MRILGGILGVLVGALLAGGLIAASGLPVYGPASALVAMFLAIGPVGSLGHVLSSIIILFGAGLGLLVATMFVYAWSAISLLGVATPAPPAAPALPAPPGELFCRGMLIGMSSSVNFLVMSAIPWLSVIAVPALLITLLALIPAVAANRFVYQRLLGFLGWILPLNYLMVPLGILLFLVNLPFAIAAGGIGAIRFDVLTATVESSGGALLGAVTSTAFNVGNFTFLSPSTPPTPFGATGVSAHETGHTLSGAAFGGFFYWVGAVDENVPPLRRGAAAYSELFAESHFSGFSFPFLPMW